MFPYHGRIPCCIPRHGTGFIVDDTPTAILTLEQYIEYTVYRASFTLKDKRQFAVNLMCRFNPAIHLAVHGLLEQFAGFLNSKLLLPNIHHTQSPGVTF